MKRASRCVSRLRRVSRSRSSRVAPRRPRAGQDRNAHRDGGDVPVPADLEVDPRGRQGLRDQHHLLADRLGRGDRRRSPPGRSTSAPPTRRCSRPARRLQGLRRRSRGPSRPRRSRTTSRASNGRLQARRADARNIYLGRITNWNDAAIKRLNAKLNLPDLKITPVYRSDGSGTTYNFTEYLSAVSPDFKSEVGVNTSVSWTDRRRRTRQLGRGGVVKKTAGALTYVDVAYSIANKFQFATDQEPRRQVRDAGPPRDQGGGLEAAEEGHEPRRS